jgi:hypothetical protein
LEKGVISINSVISNLSTGNTSFSSHDNSLLLDEYSDVQPSLHENKKWCCESFFKSLFNNYDLTKSEYKTYNALRRECMQKYDENNKEHEKLLKDFYDTFLEIYKKEDSSWKLLGFQVIILNI